MQLKTPVYLIILSIILSVQSQKNNFIKSQDENSSKNPANDFLALILNDSTYDTIEEEPKSRKARDCKPTITMTNACQGVCSESLIFEENFDTFDSTTWNHEVRIPAYVGEREFVSYQNRGENCYANMGELHILPSLINETSGFTTVLGGGKLDLSSSCTVPSPSECILTAKKFNILPPVVSARISTKRSFQFRYGRVEVRAKLPKGDWLFPLIQLDPVENIYGPENYASGQIRLALASGNVDLLDSGNNIVSGERMIGGVVLSSQPHGRRYLYPHLENDHLGNAFHNYSIIWTDKEIIMKIDGLQYGGIKGDFKKIDKIKHAERWKNGGYMAPFDQKFYITLGVSVGGIVEFANVNQKPWKNTDPKALYQFWKARDTWYSTWKGTDVGLHVDYVRVYAI